MADLGKLINDKTAADTQWREQRQAEREAAAALRDESVVEITTSPEAYARYLDMQGDNPSYSADESSQSPLYSVFTCGENCARSLAPPLPTRPAPLGSRWVPEC